MAPILGRGYQYGVGESGNPNGLQVKWNWPLQHLMKTDPGTFQLRALYTLQDLEAPGDNNNSPMNRALSKVQADC